jgi:hypothetical protein
MAPRVFEPKPELTFAGREMRAIKIAPGLRPSG